jgi:hypothetical protein
MFLPCSQVCLGVNKISTDATPDLSRDIKQLLIKLLLLAAKYAQKLNVVPVFNIYNLWISIHYNFCSVSLL